MYFLGGKGGRCVRLTTLPPSGTVVMKSENLNFLEPSGPLQAWKGTALAFYVFGKWTSYGLGLRTALECEAKEECAAFGLNFKYCIYRGLHYD